MSNKNNDEAKSVDKIIGKGLNSSVIKLRKCERGKKLYFQPYNYYSDHKNSNL